MSRRYSKKSMKPAPLAKAHVPMNVAPMSFLDNFQEQLQKQNMRKVALEALYASYRKNAWVARAINAISASVTANGWKPMPLDSKAQPDAKAEAYLSKFLSQPNDRDSFEDVIGLTVVDLIISGDSYWEVSRMSSNSAANKTIKAKMNDTLAKDSEYALMIQDSVDASLEELDGLPLALWHIDARTMTKQTDEHGRIVTYTQILLDGKRVVFQPSQIMNFCVRGVEDEVYGTSALAPLEIDLVIDLYRQTYIKSQLENSTKIGNIISMAGASPDEIARFQEWLNLRARGPAQAGQNIVIQGDKTDIKSAPNDGYDAASELSNSLKEKILTTLGVPVSKLGTIDKGTLGDSNQDGANKSYIEITVKPLARLIERQFNLGLIPDFQVVGISGYGITILTEDIDLIATRAAMVTELVNAGIMTRNQARLELKMVPYADEGDVPIVMTSSGAMKLSDIESGQADMQAIHAKVDSIAGGSNKTPESKAVTKALQDIALDLRKALSDGK